MKFILALALLVAIASATISNADRACNGSDTNHTTLYFGSSPTDKCIHNTCIANLPKVLALVSDNQTGISVVQNVGDLTEVDITIEHSDVSCEGSECLDSDCFAIELQAVIDHAGTPAPEDLTAGGNITDTTFTIDKAHYDNTTLCANNGNGTYTCDFYVNFKLTTVDEIFARRYFSIELTQTAGADTVTATLAGQSIVMKAEDIGTGYTSDIRNDPQALTGTLAHAVAPASIKVGQQLDLVLTAPNPSHQHQYDIDTLVVTLESAGSGDPITVDVLASPAAANSAAQGPNDNTLTFSINANFIGTYDVKAVASLIPDSNVVRRLEEVEVQRVGGEGLTITVLPYETDYSAVLYSVAAVSVLLAAAGVFFSVKAKELRNQIQYQKSKDIEC